MKPISRIISLVILVMCAAAMLCAVLTAAAALTIAEKPLWLVAGFECVVFSAGVLGVQFARGKYQQGQGLALACVAATICIATALAYLSVQGRFQVRGRDEPVSLSMWLYARVALSLVLGVLGAFVVLSRNPKSFGYLVRAGLAGGPLLLLAAAAYVGRGRIPGLVSTIGGTSTMIIGCIMGLIVVGLVSAGGHCLIRAFELGRSEEDTAIR